MTDRITAYKDPKLPPPEVISTGPDWVDVLQTISPAAGEILVAVIRTLYPHDRLPDVIYRRVVRKLDHLATASLPAAQHVEAFLAKLADAWPIPFPDLAETFRVQALKHIEQTPEFFFLQRQAVRHLYDDVEIWAAFGYQGASVHLGGYVKRGFDDLAWLPPLPNDI